MANIENARSIYLANANPRLLSGPNSDIILTSSLPVFHVDTAGNPATNIITFNAIPVAMEAGQTFLFTIEGGTLSNVAGNTAALLFSNMTANTATITVTVNYRNKTYTKSTKISKLFDAEGGTQGLNNATVYAFQRSATTVTSNPGAVSYSFTAAGITTGTLANGWQKTIPSGTDPLYVTAASASSANTTDTIAANEWSAPVILAQNGTAGLNNATVAIYQRTVANTAPALPSTTTTYTFATAVLTGLNNGWATSVPAASNGQYLWISTATAANTTATDTITSSEWAAAQLMAQSGTQGARGNVQVARAITGAVWSDSEAALAISGAGYGVPQNRDVVTLYNSAAGFSQVKYYDGSAWQALSAYFPGSVLVDGTVVASKIDARGLSIKDAAGNVILSAGMPLTSQTKSNRNLIPAIFGWPSANFTVASRGLSPGDARFVNGEYLIFPDGTGYVGAQTAAIGAAAGSVLTVSFDAYTLAGTRTLYADFYGPNVDSPGLGSGAGAVITTTNTRYKFTDTLSHASSPQAALRMFCAAAGGTVIVGNIKVEYGNNETAWTDNVITSSNVGSIVSPNSITNTEIGGDLLSTNWNWQIGPGGLGWRLDRAGNFYCNSIAVRGSIAGLSYTGYVWPAYGLSGFYLGPEGLLLGNFNGGVGGYFEVTSTGNIYAPGFSLVNSQLTLTNPVIIAPNLQLTDRTVSISSPSGTFFSHSRLSTESWCGSHTASIANAVSPTYVWTLNGGNTWASFAFDGSTTNAQCSLVVRPRGTTANVSATCTITCTISDGGFTKSVSQFISADFT